MVYENERRIPDKITKDVLRKKSMVMKLKNQSRQLDGVVRGQTMGLEDNMADVDRLEKYRCARMRRRFILDSKRVRNISTRAKNTQSCNTQQNTTRITNISTSTNNTQSCNSQQNTEGKFIKLEGVS